MNDDIGTQQDASEAAQPITAGVALRSAREASGLSVSDVAVQLKLAPRQVLALEEDDYSSLPGRTFARGFARNYARLMQLDSDKVIALMPGAERAPALERPTLATSRRPMGEIPVERAPKRSAVPKLLLVLVLVVAGAAAYHEFAATGFQALRDSGFMPAAVPAETPGASPAASDGATTALPNPVTDATPQSAPPVPAGPAGPAPAADTAPSAAAVLSDSATAARPGDAALVLAFKGTSWAEVKDATGRVILQMTGSAGMTQSVAGAPPLEIALGNAPDVVVTFRGQTLELGPYTRGGVARVSLK